MKNTVEIFLLSFDDNLLGQILGCDVRILSQDASIADFLTALDDFANKHLADCRGCDACCQERAPLIAADVPLLASLLPDNPYPAHAVCTDFATLTVEQGVADIILRRDHNNFCKQLNQAGRFCNIWPQRPFVCRSHFCLPRSHRFEQLRSSIVNIGENELTRLLLAEEHTGATAIASTYLANILKEEDYPENGQSGRTAYTQIRLRDCVDEALWQELIQ